MSQPPVSPPIIEAAGTPYPTGVPLIPYAPEESLDLSGDRVLRRIVGLTATVFGGLGILKFAVHVALAKGWVATPNTMSWSLEGGWNAVVFGAQVAVDCLYVLAGILVLRRSAKLSVLLLRTTFVLDVLLSAASIATAMYAIPVIRTYYSTPASAFVEASSWLGGLWVPLLLALLTLPPLDKRLA